MQNEDDELLDRVDDFFNMNYPKKLKNHLKDYIVPVHWRGIPMAFGVSRLFQAHFDFNVMQRHCEISNKGLKTEIDDLWEVMEKQIASLKEDELDPFLRDVNDLWIDTAETIPRLQWYSQLMIAFGYFEKMMNDICLEIEKGRAIPVSLFDLRGRGIVRARDYLYKHVNVKQPFTGRKWRQIKLIAKLRNAIAHNNGFVEYEPESERSTFSQLSKIPKIELKQEMMNQPDAQIVFDSELVLDVLKNFDSFALDLANELCRVDKAWRE